MSAEDNIIRLATAQENGELLPPTSELAIAMAFAHEHADDLRYVAAWHRWYHFDGGCWVRDTTLQVFDRVRALCGEIALAEDKPVRSVASAKTVAAVEWLARADRRLAATTEQWDSDGWLIHAGDTTIDLRTGVGRAPDAHDYITRRTACSCAPPGTPHPLWTRFLYRVTNDNPDLVDFLQRYCGYCLTGLTVEHAFVFAHGGGANGKSTFTSTVAGVLGDYATTADMTTFLASNNEKHPTDLAKLNGARLVVAQETQKGRRWDEVRIKALVAGDRISARYMRQDFFDFTPVLKLFISGNHKPRLGSIDEAMRRRLLLVPFTVSIPAGERDPGLPHKLETEWPAILRWMVDGCLQWQRIGLVPPAVVRDASEGYFRDEDTLGQWLSDCTYDGGPLALTLTKELFSSWKLWCEDNNLRPGSQQALSEALSVRGYAKKRDGAGRRGFSNLALVKP